MKILLLLIFVKFNLCLVYVDIKNFTLSDGVIAHHGRYAKKHKYMMFVGLNDPIELVKYDGIPLFPFSSDPKLKYSLIVEYYRYEVDFAIIFVTRTDDTNKEEFFLKHYAYVNGIFKETIKHTHKIDCAKIRLSIDLNENVPTHPFITVSKNDYQDHTVFIYDAIKEYKGIKFNGKGNRQYAIGKVFDSSVEILVEYTPYDNFIEQCDSFTVEYRQGEQKIVVYNRGKIITYEKTVLNSKTFWSFTGPKIYVKKSFFAPGLMVKQRLDIDKRLKHLVKLDLSEKVSMRLNDIVKTTGMLNSKEYIIYQNKPGSAPIQSVLESKRDRAKIYMPDTTETIMSVEVVDDGKNKHIKINILFDDLGLYRKITKIFEKRKYTSEYYLINEPRMFEKLLLYYNSHQVLIDLDIDEESKVIYQRVNLVDPVFKFNYYYINDYDEFENNLKGKYIFGKIKEIEPYECGNVPRDKNIKEYRTIKEEVYSSELLVLNPFPNKPVLVKSYEIYKLVS